jgi:hypothetical protein
MLLPYALFRLMVGLKLPLLGPRPFWLYVGIVRNSPTLHRGRNAGLNSGSHAESGPAHHRRHAKCCAGLGRYPYADSGRSG